MERIKKLMQVRLVRFCIVGFSGVFIHFGILYGLTSLGLFYAWSAVIAIVVAATYNYTINNKWTFKENRYVGKQVFWVGWVRYCLVSFVGDGAYLGFMVLLVEKAHLWYLLAATISMVLIMLVKFVVVRRFIWAKSS